MIRALILAISAVLVAGCNDQAYCFDCSAPSEEDAGKEAGAKDSDIDLDKSDAYDLDAVVTDPEDCGDKTTVDNCGQCGNRCLRRNAFSSCEKNDDGRYACVYECAPGLIDRNDDLSAKESDGCEYACVETNEGEEICDGVDNDCNGEVDDGTDTDDNPMSCGACGNVCSFTNATARCEAGVCELDECRAGFHNLDGDDENGCEYQCTPTNEGVEICDSLDNDCNHEVDDVPAATVATDSENCGACFQSCVGIFEHGTDVCVDGECQIASCAPGFFDKDEDETNGCEEACGFDCRFPFANSRCDDTGLCELTGCFENYHDINQIQEPGADGCEYFCEVSNDGVEICDGLDNDCNGEVDDGIALEDDPENCGQCGFSCAGVFANSAAVCAEGACTLECLPGYADANGDGSEPEGDGCEFSCFGCTYANASPDAEHCAEHGVCRLGVCAEEFFDLDGDESNGCEYQCQLATGEQDVEGTEPESACNGLDDDCDGETDEGFDLDTDPDNCGRCGFGCSFYLNAQGVCTDGACSLGGCLDGFVDLDQDAQNGCECQASGEEICNGVDDDCDGLVDNVDALAEDLCTEYQVASCGGVPACVGGLPICLFDASDEICDGQDNDCDGAVDEDGPEDPLPGVGQVCGSVEPIGRCRRGQQACVDGEFVCEGEVVAAAGESCNGLDDDCDGETDEDPTVPEQCDVYQIENCGAVTLCVSGAPTCMWNANPEVCDGLDNDCDLEVDESPAGDPLPGLGQFCSNATPAPPQIGQCQLGTYTRCEEGLLICEGEVGPGTETCNGADDDCDGEVDEGLASVPDVCTDYQRTSCGGVTTCLRGAPTCTFQTSQEICDGLDNDCNGQTDEGSVPGLGQACGDVEQVGRCRLGTYTSCEEGELVCTGAVLPTSEICNGVDDDCDGQVDESLTAGNDVHDTGDPCPPAGFTEAASYPGVCEAGSWSCVQSYEGGTLQGDWECLDSIDPEDEICDASSLDENCDTESNEGCLAPGSGPTRLDTGGGSVTTSGVGADHTFQLAVASAGESIVAVYADVRDDDGSSDYAQPRLFGRVSATAGVTWSAEQKIGSSSAGDQVEPNLFMHTGRAYLTYGEFLAEDNRVRRIYVRSANGANFNSWSTPARIDGTSTDGDIDHYSPQGVVADVGTSTATDRLAVVWSEVEASSCTPPCTVEPERDIFVAYSVNGGTAWSVPARVNPTPDDGSAPAELPAIATDGNGMVYIAWRQKSDGSARMYLRRLDLNAGSPALEEAIALENAGTDEGVDDVAIAADSLGNVHVAWTDVDDYAIRVATGTDCGGGSSRATCLASLDIGGTIVSPGSVASHTPVARPSIAAQDGEVIVAWEDTRSGNADIRVTRADAAGGWEWLDLEQLADAEELGANVSSDPHVAFADTGRAVVTWVDMRDGERSSVYANTSLDGGATFFDGDSAYALRVDSSADADSITPFVVTNRDRAAPGPATVIWVDFLDAGGENGNNGDVYARQLQ